MKELAIVMMQKNEGAILSSWLDYHSRIVDCDSIFILDNSSTDIGTFSTLVDAQRRGCNVNFGVEPFESKGLLISALIRRLVSDFKYVIPLDCDEFLGVLLDGSFSPERRHIITELERSSTAGDCYIRVPHSIWNIPFTTKGYYQPLKKIIVAGKKDAELDLGYHLYDFYKESPTVDEKLIKSSEICYLHFHNAPFEKVLKSARMKMRARISSLDDVSISNYQGAGKHLLRYFFMSERDYMASLPDASTDLGDIFQRQGLVMPYSHFYYE